MSSIGSETKTGPIGGVCAMWMARASTAGTSLAMAGSADHLMKGRGTSVASTFVSRQTWFCMLRRWFPAVITNGVLFHAAL